MNTRVNQQDRDQTPSSLLVPAGTPGWVTPELIADTLSTWQPYYSAALTPDDALAILLNVGRFFDVVVLQEGQR